MSNLLRKAKNAYEIMSPEELRDAYEYCEGYKKFLDEGKIERFCVEYAVNLAEERGFEVFDYGKKYKPGDKVYFVQHNRAAIFAVIGTESPEDGFNIVAAHVDCPKLDLKPNPLYEDSGFALFKTHYYGGIRKYQWVATPLALCGVVCKKSGETLRVTIGLDESDPVFFISDLLPHLAKDQSSKPLDSAFTGENLNVLLASIPAKETETDALKTTVMKLLNEKYGIVEDDFLTADLSVVPAGRARDLGLDRSMILAYGHDDRIDAYPALLSLFELTSPAKTCVAVLADREEVGSMGISGMRSSYFADFLKALCCGYNERKAFANSAALSADVSAAYDPNFADVFEKQNSAFFNRGIAVCKYTGSRGKGGSSEAPAEFMAKIFRIFEGAGVLYQVAELGKVDQGGGGTVAQFISDLNIPVLDVGVALLSMHAPYEAASKTDIYYTHKACRAFFEKY